MCANETVDYNPQDKRIVSNCSDRFKSVSSVYYQKAICAKEYVRITANRPFSSLPPLGVLIQMIYN
jgi:hypothetical protein